MKKILITILILMLAFSTISCKKKLVDGGANHNNENNLIIEVKEASYSIGFLEQIKKIFEDTYVGKTVTIIPQGGLLNGEVETKIKSGEKFNTTDLFFGCDVQIHNYVAKGNQMNKSYKCILEPLNDLLNSKCYNENMLVKDKIKSEYIDYFKYNDGYVYSLPWATGITGLVYRSDFFENNNLQVPRTTLELQRLTNTIKSLGWIPFTWNKYGYWQYCYYTWWAQYEGKDNFIDFFNPKDKNGEYVSDKFTQDGRYYALDYLDTLLKDENGNSLTGSIGFSGSEADTIFMDTQAEDGKKVAMAPNGDWLENGMSKTYPKGSVNIKMMKLPIISNIIDNLTTVKSEDKLLEVIDAIDNNENCLDDVSMEDFSRVKEARNLTYSNGYQHNVLIPSYSNAKDLAKDFLKILYSDKGQQIFFDTASNFLPLNSEISTKKDNLDKMTCFQKSIADISKNLIGITNIYYIDPAFYLYNLKAFNKYSYIEIKLAGKDKDYKSGLDIYNEELNWIKEREQDYFKK